MITRKHTSGKRKKIHTSKTIRKKEQPEQGPNSKESVENSENQDENSKNQDENGENQAENSENKAENSENKAENSENQAENSENQAENSENKEDEIKLTKNVDENKYIENKPLIIQVDSFEKLSNEIYEKLSKINAYSTDNGENSENQNKCKLNYFFYILYVSYYHVLKYLEYDLLNSQQLKTLIKYDNDKDDSDQDNKNTKQRDEFQNPVYEFSNLIIDTLDINNITGEKKQLKILSDSLCLYYTIHEKHIDDYEEIRSTLQRNVNTFNTHTNCFAFILNNPIHKGEQLPDEIFSQSPRKHDFHYKLSWLLSNNGAIVRDQSGAIHQYIEGKYSKENEMFLENAYMAGYMKTIS